MLHKVCASFVVILPLVAAPVFAQQHEEHHPDAVSSAATRGAAMPGGSMESGPGGMPMTGMMRTMMGQEGMGRMMAVMAERVEGRLAFLKTELKITEPQLPLWNAVADAMRASAKSMSDIASGTMGASQPGTLPDKLAMREKMMAAHLDALRKFKAAVEPLYAALNDEQKKTADDLLIGPMGMM
jgi:hypothetical protein